MSRNHRAGIRWMVQGGASGYKLVDQVHWCEKSRPHLASEDLLNLAMRIPILTANQQVNHLEMGAFPACQVWLAKYAHHSTNKSWIDFMFLNLSVVFPIYAKQIKYRTYMYLLAHPS